MDESLSFESLLEGAKKAGHKAMDDHGRGEYDEFALHGGVAVERLAKAVLVSKNPVYLLEMRNGNPDMLLYLGGHLEISADKIRTVGAKDAIKRLRTMGLLPPDTQLDLLIELRNGTAHTTVGDQAKALLPALADNVAALLNGIGLGNDDFWGRWSSAMYIAVDRQRDEVERDVELRIRQAWHRFSDRFAGLPEGAMEKVLEEPTEGIRTITLSNHDDLLIGLSSAPCPACGRPAHVRFAPAVSDGIGTVLEVTALHCTLCALDLNSHAEIKAAQVQIRPETFGVGLTSAEGVAIGEMHAG
ncbi:hypothetical protein ACIQZB_33740 [Streptomyces sp. NPDC097727]|uniref:hypothetical protein n=1 Tax=Streptomyces sp. NPDC097727 TaxID=3366092 RepID=UPI00381FDF7C